MLNNLLETLKVSEYIVKDVVVLRNTNTTLSEVASIMANKDIGSLVVIDSNDRVIGIITERNIIKAIAENLDLNKETVGDHMNKNVETISVDALIIEVLKKIIEKGYEHYPIVDGEGRLKGLLSLKDISRAAFRSIIAIISTLSTK